MDPSKQTAIPPLGGATPGASSRGAPEAGQGFQRNGGQITLTLLLKWTTEQASPSMPKPPTLNRFPLFGLLRTRPRGILAILRRMLDSWPTPRPCSTRFSRPRPKRRRRRPRGSLSRRNCPRRSRPRRRRCTSAGRISRSSTARGSGLSKPLSGMKSTMPSSMIPKSRRSFPRVGTTALPRHSTSTLPPTIPSS